MSICYWMYNKIIFSKFYMQTDTFNFDDLITILEASEYSGLSDRHIRLLLAQGKVCGKKLGHDWVTTKKCIDEYLNQKNKRGRKSKRD